MFFGTSAFLNFSQHLKIFGNLGIAARTRQSREIPDPFHANHIRSFVISLLPFFSWNWKTIKTLDSILKYFETNPTFSVQI
jgi:hypothetical protein